MAVTQMEQEQALLEALKAVIDPNTGKDFVSSKALKNVTMNTYLRRQYFDKYSLRILKLNLFYGLSFSTFDYAIYLPILAVKKIIDIMGRKDGPNDTKWTKLNLSVIKWGSVTAKVSTISSATHISCLDARMQVACVKPSRFEISWTHE